MSNAWKWAEDNRPEELAAAMAGAGTPLETYPWDMGQRVTLLDQSMTIEGDDTAADIPYAWMSLRCGGRRLLLLDVEGPVGAVSFTSRVGKELFLALVRRGVKVVEAALPGITQVLSEINAEKGFREGYDPGDARHAISTLGLITSEVGEAVDAVRKPGPSEHIPAFSGLAEELADVIIRTLDMADMHEVDIASAIWAKLAYNITRGYRHGGKRA